jgi:hypothetical protein
MAARGWEAKDLSAASGVDRDVIANARQGGRISRDSLMRIADALLKAKVHPMAAALINGTADASLAPFAPAARRGKPKKKVA